MRFAPTSFRPAFGRVLSIVIALIALGGLISFVAVGDGAGLLRYGWGLLLLAALTFALFWLPSLDVAEHEVTVRNVFSTVHVPWPAIERIDTKYALTLYTPRGKVAAWASPAPSRYASQVSRTRDARLAAAAAGTDPRPGDLLDTMSGAAAYVIRRHWDDLREDGHLDNPVIEEGGLRRDIHWVTIVVLGALTLATALGLFL
jgi:hypothetical protein